MLGRLVAIRRAETVGVEPQRGGQHRELRVGEGAQRSQRDVGVEPGTHRPHLGDAPGERFGEQPDDDAQHVMDETHPARDPALMQSGFGPAKGTRYAWKIARCQPDLS